MTNPDTSALRALRDTSKVNFVAALVSAAPDLLDELDRLRGQVARVEALDAPRYAVNPETQDYECAILESDITQALAIPAEGGE